MIQRMWISPDPTPGVAPTTSPPPLLAAVKGGWFARRTGFGDDGGGDNMIIDTSGEGDGGRGFDRGA